MENWKCKTCQEKQEISSELERIENEIEVVKKMLFTQAFRHNIKVSLNNIKKRIEYLEGKTA